MREGLKIEFKKRQTKFDKRLRTEKCNFIRGLSLYIDYLQAHNTQQFWKEVNRLGPRQSREIPIEVKLENGKCSPDLGVVLQK